jgi:hypothetical protein
MDRGRGGGGRVACSHAVVLRRGYFPGCLIAFEHFLSIDDPATKVSRLIRHTVHWQSWALARFNRQSAWFGLLSETGPTPGTAALRCWCVSLSPEISPDESTPSSAHGSWSSRRLSRGYFRSRGISARRFSWARWSHWAFSIRHCGSDRGNKKAVDPLWPLLRRSGAKGAAPIFVCWPYLPPSRPDLNPGCPHLQGGPRMF